MNREMKDSGIEWIGEIPKNWIIVKIKNIASIYTGNSIKDEEKELFVDNVDAIPYVATKDVDVSLQKINYKNGMYVKRQDVSFKRAKAESTLLCIEGGSAGKKLAFTNQEVCFVNKLCCFHSATDVNKYIYYYLASPAFTIPFGSYVSGLIGGVSIGKLREFTIIRPPLDEQRRIANFLDRQCAELDAVMEKTRAAIEEYKKLKQAVITQAVTRGVRGARPMKNSGIEWIGEIPAEWETSKIGSLYVERKTKVSDVDYPPLSVTKKGILPQLETAAKTEAHDDRKLVCKGDFAINSRSDRRGSCGISAYEGSVSLINTILSPRKEMNPEYYDRLFHCSLFSDEFYKWGHGIVDDLWTTNWQDMKNIYIPTPPLEEQIEISTYLDRQCGEIDALIAKEERRLAEIETCKKSLIYETVTGKREVV